MNEASTSNPMDEREPYVAELLDDGAVAPDQAVGTLEDQSEQADIWASTLGSFALLGINVYLLYLYYTLFGFHLSIEGSPERWKALGGLVGVVGVLIRLAVVAVFACPYTILALFGITLSSRVTGRSSNVLGALNWCLLVGHVVLLLPLLWLFLSVVVFSGASR